MNIRRHGEIVDSDGLIKCVITYELNCQRVTASRVADKLNARNHYTCSLCTSGVIVISLILMG